jgi:hypothetical protein
VGWSIFLCAVFTIASAYSGLKVGQVMEAAIPISILPIGLARVCPRGSTMVENVIITGIGGLAGSVVAGAIFTLLALYIRKLDPHPLQTIYIYMASGRFVFLFLIRCGAMSCETCTVASRIPRRRLLRKYLPPAKRADRKPSCCCKPHSLELSTISWSPPFIASALLFLGLCAYIWFGSLTKGKATA